MVEGTNKSEVQRTWSVERIREANDRSGFQILNAVVTGAIYTTGIFIVLYTIVAFIAQHINVATPNFLHEYIINPIHIPNMILLLVLTHGHDRYYRITKESLILSNFPLLQVLDFITKISLLFFLAVQCIWIEGFVLICTYGYILTLIRACYLKKKVDKENPLYSLVEEVWLVNNIRHNCVMFIWFVFYYGLLRTNWLYYFVCMAVNMDIDFENPETKVILFVVRLSVLIVFDFYWIHRVLHKVTTHPNKNFHADNEMQFKEKVDEYYAQANKS